MTELNKSKVLFLATNGFQEDELFSPREALMEAGATVELASLELDEISAGESDSRKIKPDMLVKDVSAKDYNALVIPGGLANPDTLRVNNEVKSLVREFAEDGKIIASICHGPWVLISSDLVKGREMTSYPTIKDDLVNAGANYVDKEVAVDNGIITSRSPNDLKAFNAKIIEEIKEGRHDRHISHKAA
ncbi:protease I [Litorimonas taeanensis]|uniref:Protease I n=1 Tax=Litorimonas taeanensis TaxID=568099 RepID=A0A420WJ25_9PROT|nr:type 1 glutamine amidotransferase domain-containing protein [Litorimonas taeanensis]RKQ70946.1 protease I [Litorimonas taeanensis]